MDFPEVSYAEWRRRVEAELGDATFEEALVRSAGGLRLEPLYAADGPAEVPEPGLAGVASWIGGASARSEGRRPWRLCQSCDAGDPATARRHLLDDLEGGADGVWLRLRPPQAATAEVAAEALERLFEGIEPAAVTVIFDSGLEAPKVAAATLGLMRRRGADPRLAEWSPAYDPLAALVAETTPSGGGEEWSRAMADLAALWAVEAPAGRAIAVSTLRWRVAGASPPMQLGLGMATLVDYLRRMTSAGLPLPAAADQVGLRLAIGREIFPAIAQLRAARDLWSRVLAVCGLEDPPALHLHAVTAAGDSPGASGEGGHLEGVAGDDDPWLEALRTTTQVFAAIVGGADCISSFPAPGGGDRPPGRRLARNTQVVLAEESFLGRVLDPAGGSYFAEALTERLSREAWAELREVERQGGMAVALEAGWVGERIAGQRQKEGR